MIKYVVRNTKFQDVKTKSKLKNQHLSLDLWMNFGYGGFERLGLVFYWGIVIYPV